MNHLLHLYLAYIHFILGFKNLPLLMHRYSYISSSDAAYITINN